MGLPEEPSLLQPLLEVLLPEEPLLPQLLLDTLLAQLLPLLVLDSQPHLTLLVSFTQLLSPTSTIFQVMLAVMPPQLLRLMFTMLPVMLPQPQQSPMLLPQLLPPLLLS